MTTLVFNNLANKPDAQNEPNVSWRVRISMLTLGLLSHVGPNHSLFMPLSILAVFSGLISYPWLRSIRFRGDEINRDVFLHTGSSNLSQRINAGLN